MSNIDDMFSHIFCHHKPRALREIKALALTYGVEPVATMFSKRATGFLVDDRPWPLAKVKLDKLPIPDLAKKAQPLTVRSLCWCEAKALSECPHLRLCVASQWKEAQLKLLLAEV